MTTSTFTTICCSRLFVLLVLLCLLGNDNANLLRGTNSNLEALRERVLRRTLPSEEHRGMTYRDLGVDTAAAEEYRHQQQRKAEIAEVASYGTPTYSYFAVSVGRFFRVVKIHWSSLDSVSPLERLLSL